MDVNASARFIHPGDDIVDEGQKDFALPLSHHEYFIAARGEKLDNMPQILPFERINQQAFEVEPIKLAIGRGRQFSTWHKQLKPNK
jgi:hypothetical protein